MYESGNEIKATKLETVLDGKSEPWLTVDAWSIKMLKVDGKVESTREMCSFLQVKLMDGCTCLMMLNELVTRVLMNALSG